MRTVIGNGKIYDGSGSAPYQKYIVIEDELIVDMTDQRPASADRWIDAKGRIVSPGFVDTHRHCDISALYDPDFGKLEVAQGLSTVIGGNCGLAPTPSTDRYRKELYDFIEPTLGIAPPAMAMASMEDYLEALNQTKQLLNVGTFVGLGAVKTAVKGYGKSPFTKEEMQVSKKMIEESLEAGAVGISTGIMYQPECYSGQDELYEMLSAGSRFGRTIVSHIRGEGDSLVDSVCEVIDLAARAELPLNISHFKATGLKNWGKTIYKAIEKIEEARNKGQDVTVDFYPYQGGSTTMFSLLPPTLLEDTLEDTIKGLEGKKGLENVRTEIYKKHPGWDNMVISIGWERILISSVTKKDNQDIVGMNMAQAASKRHYEDVAEFMRDIMVEEQGKISIILLSMSEADVDAVARLPYSMVISDGLYGVSDSPHPRLYGAFPKVIRDFVMDRHILTLEEAIKKMTSMPAERLKLDRRGRLKPGYYADINIFSPKELTDYATYDNPKQLCSGMYHMMVNGQSLLVEDKLISSGQGKTIRL